MSATSDSLPALEALPEAEQASRLLRLGQLAAQEGDRRLARRLLKHAAMLAPTNEAVWLALLPLLDDEADRRVCLQNILAINPDNQRAHALLADYEQDTQPSGAVQLLRPRRRPSFWSVLFWILEAIMILILIGLGILLLSSAF